MGLFNLFAITKFKHDLRGQEMTRTFKFVRILGVNCAEVEKWIGLVFGIGLQYIGRESECLRSLKGNGSSPHNLI